MMKGNTMITSPCERGAGATRGGLWRCEQECGILLSASKTEYNGKGQACGGLDLCSTVTMEVTMLFISSTQSLPDFGLFANYLFVIPHNQVDRVRLAGGAA